jgi:quinol monooxygenase YgiN
MSAVRVIVSVTAPSVEAADEAIRQRVEACKKIEATEEGCLQYEVFRSVMRPECYTLMELWASKAVYDKHWSLVQEREGAKPASPPPTGSARPTVEMYKQTIFQRVDGIWQAADADERMETIRWT